MNAKTLIKNISTLLKGRTFAPAITGNPFWSTDLSTSQEVQLKAYSSAKQKIYFKLDSKKSDEQVYVSAGNFHDELQTFTEGDVVTAEVAIRTPNEMSDTDIKSCVEAYGEASIKAWQEAFDNDYVQLSLVSYED